MTLIPSHLVPAEINHKDPQDNHKFSGNGICPFYDEVSQCYYVILKRFLGMFSNLLRLPSFERLYT
jgi:hypothetical protein